MFFLKPSDILNYDSFKSLVVLEQDISFEKALNPKDPSQAAIAAAATPAFGQTLQEAVFTSPNNKFKPFSLTSTQHKQQKTVSVLNSKNNRSYDQNNRQLAAPEISFFPFNNASNCLPSAVVHKTTTASPAFTSAGQMQQQNTSNCIGKSLHGQKTV